MALSTARFKNKREFVEWINFQMPDKCRINEDDIDERLMNEMNKTPAGIVTESLHEFATIKLNSYKMRKCYNTSALIRTLIINRRYDIWKGNVLVTTEITDHDSISISKERHVCTRTTGYFKFCQCVIQRLSVIDDLLNSVSTTKSIELLPLELAKDQCLMQHLSHSLSIENEEVNIPNIANIMAATEYIVDVGLENISTDNILYAHKILKPKNCKEKELGRLRDHMVTITGPRGVKVKASQPKDLPKLMKKFFLKTKDILKSNFHPVIQAALVKFLFVNLHPLSDGNGRLSRILLNAVLQQRKYLSVDYNSNS